MQKMVEKDFPNWCKPLKKNGTEKHNKLILYTKEQWAKIKRKKKIESKSRKINLKRG